MAGLSTPRVRRWRERNPELNRERQRLYVLRYSLTAKGMVADARKRARRRST